MSQTARSRSFLCCVLVPKLSYFPSCKPHYMTCYPSHQCQKRSVERSYFKPGPICDANLDRAEIPTPPLTSAQEHALQFSHHSAPVLLPGKLALDALQPSNSTSSCQISHTASCRGQISTRQPPNNDPMSVGHTQMCLGGFGVDVNRVCCKIFANFSKESKQFVHTSSSACNCLISQ